MTIRPVTHHKEDYLPLLLLGDEQESMIFRYLPRGTLYVLEEDGVKGVCVVTDEGDGILEIKNIAVDPAAQRRGYGKAMVEFILRTYRGRYTILQVGTGDSPSTIPFYEACGFVRSHIRENFFLDNYDHPIFEDGKQLIHMVYLRRPF